MIYLKIIYFNTFDAFGLNLLHLYIMPSCLAWNIPEPKHARPYLEQNNVSMMSQGSDASRIPPWFNCWTSVAPVFQYWSCCWVLSALNLDLYVAVLIHWSVEVRHANWTTYMFSLWSTSESRARVTAAWNRCNSLSCPPGQLAPPPGASCPRLSYPPPWLSSPLGGKLSRPVYLAPHPYRGNNLSWCFQFICNILWYLHVFLKL